MPLPMVTSLCFAGDDLRDLYIVTGSRGGPSENCGSIFRARVDVAGLAVAAGAESPPDRGVTMKVFVFDLLAYGEQLDHLKTGTELPYPLPAAISDPRSRSAPTPSISTPGN